MLAPGLCSQWDRGHIPHRYGQFPRTPSAAAAGWAAQSSCEPLPQDTERAQHEGGNNGQAEASAGDIRIKSVHQHIALRIHGYTVADAVTVPFRIKLPDPSNRATASPWFIKIGLVTIVPWAGS
jgi:hypothetical protein